MYQGRVVLLPLSTILLLAGCGGGGGSDSSEASNVINNATRYSLSELETASKTLANKSYVGRTSTAYLELTSAQKAFNISFDESLSDLAEALVKEVKSNVENNLSNGRYQCGFSGHVTFNQGTSEHSSEVASITYEACRASYGSSEINGTTVISAYDLSTYSNEYLVFFDKLNFTSEQVKFSISGMFSSKNDITQSGRNTTQFVTVTVNDEQYKLESEHVYTPNTTTPNYSAHSNVFIDSIGKLSLAYEGDHFYPLASSNDSVTISADKNGLLTYYRGAIRYAEDNNKDGNYEKGVWLSNLEVFTTGTLNEYQLVELDQLTIPPSVNPPTMHASYVDTTTPVKVQPGYYSDLDTPTEDLVVSYRWYINDKIVPDVSGNVLPAYKAVFKDTLEVSMVVFDGSNYAESERISIKIEDAPAQAQIENLPDTVNAGDYIEFNAVIYDPDIQHTSGVSASLVSGPDGVSVGENGTMTWQVPSNPLFHTQNYTFTFSSPSTGSMVFSEQVEVHSANVEVLARSGIEVPKINHSMAIGDFDSEGKNEILSTDGHSRVFLLRHTENGYQQSWMYPYSFGKDESVVQVLGSDVDNDGSKDILVATSHHIWSISDLNALPEPLLTTENVIQSALVGDIDNDGIDELVYLSQGSNQTITVVEYNRPLTPTFIFDVHSVKEIAFGNIDTDPQFELVTNTGLVYDLSTGLNEWYLVMGFGEHYVEVADINNDHIEEIIGADLWGSIYVYSGTDKTQLATLERFNTCDLSSAFFPDEKKSALLVGDCQWGNITAFSLDNNSLVELWTVSTQGHGAVSLTPGDADNDGQQELIWGTGISSSGGDSLITADITYSSISVNKGLTTHQLDSFSAAGWANMLQNDERAVFFVPQTGSGYDGSKVLTVTLDGKIDASDEISSNWDRSRIAVTTDYNQDGAGDIFIPTSETYDGSFGVMQLHDSSIQYEITGDYDNNIHVIKAFDVNEDGYEDAVYLDSNTLKAVDIQNQRLLATFTATSKIKDFDIVNVDGEIFIALSSSSYSVDQTSLLEYEGSKFKVISSSETECRRLTFINADKDSNKELACYNNNGRSLHLFNVSNTNLEEVSKTTLNYQIVDMIVNPMSNDQQTLLVTIPSGSNHYTSANENLVMKSITSDGNSIWSSLPLVGSPQSHSMHARRSIQGELEVLLATTQAMYWLGRSTTQ
ncbi:FG-GAP repeat domain-containing protein [Vibrio atypicus]|uniref:FG-GAP repeat domain-containing protein n=1 Tax=Vibrio atypicus TaxID=558271 RepID=UPI003735C33F